MSLQTSRDEWVASAELRTEGGEFWVLDYFLQEFDGKENTNFFGLRIDKSTATGEILEREETNAITESRDEILIMAKAFAKGSVPPVTLLEMTDDWQSEVNLVPASSV
jgi:hypothetical protein